ncbi:hypothetical protein ACIQF6_18240 [Kitasatospora sp. NPDC092948]|uniref:hypothetical protein n=1 Tax=Kitasatospora sp. NPDC092948 TaxID=3364088 RepID=UPI00382120A2
MAAPTLHAPMGETLVTDEEFDLMIGELELDAPENAPSASTCAVQHMYCALQ